MKIEVPEQIDAAERLGVVHLVGIGGAGLSAIARIMLERGITVQGSDAADSDLLRALERDGATVTVGQAADNLGEADTVIATTAVRADNPEIVAALARGLRLYPRSAGLQSVMVGHDVVAVAGTHGKTTTTSMLASALVHAGLDPSYAIGAPVASLGTNAHAGTGRWFVAEADESDGAFLVYEPYAAVVTNVDADHLDVWGTPEAYEQAFARFVDRVSPDGFLVLCVDDPGAAALEARAEGRGLRVLRAGLGESAELRGTDLVTEGGGTSFAVVRRGESLGRVRLQVPGEHYVVDALGALGAALECGASFADAAAGLAAYTGASRRMERIGEGAGVTVYDSYAHHPVEIAGDLQAARALAGDGRVVVAFQPHLVSRTRIFGTAMGEALSAADVVVVTDVYLAREDADPDVTSALVREAVSLPPEDVHAGADLETLDAQLADLAAEGDLVLLLGAGDITTVGPRLVARLRERAAGS
ncbi:UDP-N-acetylmuramate--L-alanine ligase [Mumia sp. zg.B17]|uniref:UDP-N-acetylmuramate--L-alanine ligase n=1 Tax=Mumia sp. zg.B17 TaxID=2855446 RepID=UPI001C6EE549|nr:UDP-N-acetylmuramate--L-alanine ligase [Mumia sp. zg.B17]MBW9206232.1 UDP-N-acetylmuramate--L-alanine ligase [Mumia sp. zg.B17]